MLYDPIFSPVLEAVMAPKETYDLIYGFTESHSGHRTYIPDANFVDYNASVKMLEQFLNDEVETLSRRKCDPAVISVATQRFMNESPELWTSGPIYHNRILKFIESAYMVPVKVKAIYEKMVSENPSMSDAIRYGVNKYLEGYMDHVCRELQFLENYIAGDEVIPLQESIDTDFRGYYLPEGLGNTIAQVPGMILMLMKKLLNKLNFALVEAGRSFSNKILQNNAINEEAIKKIYEVYQAKSKSGVQKGIKYPDPKVINDLRQSNATGFEQFKQQMINAVQTKNFKNVDAGVVAIIQKFQVIRANQTLPSNASFQEFRTAVLSIANNIIMMSDFMSTLKAIDDAITSESGIDPKKLDAQLDSQTKRNRQYAQQNAEKAGQTGITESVEEFDLFVMNENQKDQKNPQSGTPGGGGGDAAAEENPTEKSPYSPNDTDLRKPDGSFLEVDGKRVSRKNSPYKLNPNGTVVIKDGAPVKKSIGARVMLKGQQTLEEKPEEFIVDLINQMYRMVSSSVLNVIVSKLGSGLESTLSSLFGESVDPETFMEDAPVENSPTENSQVSEPSAPAEGDQQGDNSFVQKLQKLAEKLGINETGEGNESLLDLNHLTDIVKSFSLGDVFDKFINGTYEIISKMLFGGDGKQNNDNSQTASDANQTPTTDQPAAAPTQNPTPQTSSVLYDDLDLITEAGAIQNVKAVAGVASAAFGGWKAINRIKSDLKDVNTLFGLFKGGSGEFGSEVAKLAGNLALKIPGCVLVKKLKEYVELEKKDPKNHAGRKKFQEEEKLLKEEIRKVFIVLIGAIAVTVGIVVFTEGGRNALQKTIENARFGKLPPVQRAGQNILNTKNAINQKVPPEIIQVYNSADNNIKNLWIYINGWLYGGMDIKGENYKTVGIADIIDQEIQSLAPYVNLRDVVQVDLTSAIQAGRTR